MHNNSVFFATSLADIIKQLMSYRVTGILTIWHAAGSRQEEAKIMIEGGRPTYVRKGFITEYANESNLSWLNSWGEINFTFQSTEPPLLQLPPPAHPLQQSIPQEHSPPTVPRRPAVTRPLSAISAATSPKPVARSRVSTKKIIKEGNSADSAYGLLPAIEPTAVIPSLTSNGRDYPLTSIPRYDRTIFLLINGRRTVAVLARLTKRPVEDVYTSLYRLKNRRLITVEARAPL